MPSPVKIAGMSEVVMVVSWSLDRRQNRCTFVFDQEDEELGRRSLARVSANDVHVIDPLVEGLASHQGDGCPASDLHHDGALENVDQRLRLTRLPPAHPSRRDL